MKNCCKQTLYDAGDAFVKDTAYEPSIGVRLWLRTYAAASPPEHHIVTVRGTQWGIQHPIECRPDLLSCVVHRAFQAQQAEVFSHVLIGDCKAIVTLEDDDQDLRFEFIRE